MDTKTLEKFAQAARRQLIEQVGAQLERVLTMDSAALRAQAKTLKQLEAAVETSSRADVVERVAYTWFNRFCALRFMDVNNYTLIGTVSPSAGFVQPELLQEAKQGQIDERLSKFVDAQQVLSLLAGRTASADPQQEAYRLLLVAVCNYYHTVMPFMFESIEDYTELLMPADLLSPNSVLQGMREALTAENCADVEVIGWLYQFYIAEKKDEVFAALKKNKKIAAADIPAATQLFTPNWIVRYLVENSLGRLWLQNRPNSRLRERMEFYVNPAMDEKTSEVFEQSIKGARQTSEVWVQGEKIGDKTSEVLRISSVEEIRVLDPAVGSAHMLVYAFELLFAMYEEEGYRAREIPKLILQHNLTGLEIDERAGALAGFALMMKAREKDRRFWGRNGQPKATPNVTVLRPPALERTQLAAMLEEATWFRQLGRSLLDLPLQDALRHDLHGMAQVKNVGSLLRPRLTVQQIRTLRERISAAQNLLNLNANRAVLPVLDQLEKLATRYHVVIANPPYMGSKGMNEELKKFLKKQYPNTKSDLFATFIERGFELNKFAGYHAMITMESWMFLSSYEKMRTELLNQSTIIDMVHMPYLGKGGTSMGINFGTAATILLNVHQPLTHGHFSCVRYFETDESGTPFEFPVQNERLGRASSAEFQKIPGSPIAYWASDAERRAFAQFPPLSKFVDTRIGIITGENSRYIRYWHEVELGKTFIVGADTQRLKYKWFLQAKGGEFRKWFGNYETVLDWSNDGHELQTRLHSSGKRVLAHNFNLDKVFHEGITWTKLSSGAFAARYQPEGYHFNDASALAFPFNSLVTKSLLAFLCSKLPVSFLKILNPTLNFLPGYIALLPIDTSLIESDRIRQISEEAVRLEEHDWDNYESSVNFSAPSIVQKRDNVSTFSESYALSRNLWNEATLRLQGLEENNNNLFIENYALYDTLESDVPFTELTLRCNPYHRYKGTSLGTASLTDVSKVCPPLAKLISRWDNFDAGLELKLVEDTMREFVSYAVGCMFGRYSLDKPGLILANAGETVEDFLRKVRMKAEGGRMNEEDESILHPLSFIPDEDNVIPLLGGEWFEDDIVARFKQFLRITFGEAHYDENLAFLERALGRDIRSYFLRDFYTHHIKMYKKRPIYWLFSSPKGSFNALIYMHRYRPDTVSIVLNDYLREFRNKLTAHKTYLEQVSISATAKRERAAALKQIGKLTKTITELETYERDTLYPLATQQLAIDLDDGVRVNYNKFGKALKKVTGLTGKG
ncbi:MAG: BREX-1 system adenine-specific DNA-methyltransferase PglX [Candidatus Promineifilaceae bacterium]